MAVLVFVVPVGTCVTVTSAPETFTIPLIDEVVSTSAKVDVENTNRAESTNAYSFLGILFLIYLVNFFILNMFMGIAARLIKC